MYEGEQYTGSLGNYWDNYEGEDTDSDGFGETNYTMQNDNNDNYPLILFLIPLNFMVFLGFSNNNFISFQYLNREC